MAGLYFMERGYIELDAEGCAAILKGYVEYLEKVPNFKLLILDDLSTAQKDNCWQIKREHHVAINHWSGPEPVMIIQIKPCFCVSSVCGSTLCGRRARAASEAAPM